MGAGSLRQPSIASLFDSPTQGETSFGVGNIKRKQRRGRWFSPYSPASSVPTFVPPANLSNPILPGRGRASTASIRQQAEKSTACTPFAVSSSRLASSSLRKVRTCYTLPGSRSPGLNLARSRGLRPETAPCPKKEVLDAPESIGHLGNSTQSGAPCDPHRYRGRHRTDIGGRPDCFGIGGRRQFSKSDGKSRNHDHGLLADRSRWVCIFPSH